MFSKTGRRTAALISLAALTICLLAGCSTATGDAVRMKVETPLHANAAVFDLKDTAKSGAYAASQQERDALGRMKLQLENAYIALYTGVYTDVAVHDKETGRIWFSNPAVYGLIEGSYITDAEKNRAYSPLRLEYYDSSYRATITNMFVSGDCITAGGRNQVRIEKTGDTLRIDYLFGQRQEDMLYYAAMTVETFERLNAEMEALADEGTITYSEWGLLEKCYEAPQLNGTEFYVLYSSASNLDLERMGDVFRVLGITADEVKAEEARTGKKKAEKNTAWFSIPLQYQLQGRDLLVSLDSSQVEYADKYKLNRIFLLENFGAAPKGAKGYLLAPNGSGMLIDNDTSNGDMTELTLDFYGTDYGKILEKSQSLSPSCTLPVFGVKNGETALFGIVESGDANAGMVASISNEELPANRAYPFFTIFQYDDASSGVSSKLNSRKVFSKTSVDTTFRTRYHFLYGETADYNGMANYYQTYLEQTGVISRQTEAEPLLTVEILGSIQKKSATFGIPMTISQPLTTFEQAEKITETLRGRGVSDMDLLLNGVLNGGLNCKAFNRADVQRELGGKKGYQSLLSRMSERGITVFTAANLVSVFQKGNGYSASTQTVRNMEKKFSTIAQYDPSTSMRGTDRQGYLVSPLYYGTLMEKFLPSYAKLEKAELYLEDIGSILPADYNEKREIHREQSKYYAVEAVKAADAAGYSLTLDAGNAYLLPYADKLINVALAAENFEIQSRSIPFVQMVLHGYVPYSGKALNMESNQRDALLEAVESGAGLHYKLMYAENTVLLNSQFTSLYSTNYALWLDDMAAQYASLSDLYKSVALSRIQSHAYLSDTVTRTTYENGVTVLVNYGKTDYTHGELTVKAGGFTVG